MYLQPTYCPNYSCKHRMKPTGRFYRKKGYYTTKHNSQRVPRYQCKDCKTYFSSNKFKDTARQHKPQINQLIFRMVASGMTMRRIARVLGISKNTVAVRIGWLARLADREHRKWLKTPEARASKVQFDEMETFEHTKCKPLSISIAVNGANGKIIDTEVAYMLCKGHLARISRGKYSWFQDTRQQASESVFQTVKKIAPPNVEITTDKKTAYRTWIKNVMPHAVHLQHKRRVNIKNSFKSKKKSKKKIYEPLFYLNMACAKIRADLGRMRRRTWTTTKKMERLQDQLLIYTAWMNEYDIA